MPNQIKIFNTIKPFNKTIEVTSDKSLSIRAILLASQAIGVSTISNLLESEDVLNAVRSIKKLGIKCKKLGNQYKILGYGLNGFEIKKNTTIDAGNSGTFARLILGLLVKSEKTVKIIGDKSLSKREDNIEPPRIGLRGSAKIYGDRTSLFYYIFRVPINISRQFLGI